jgi:hypothetical protein
MPGMEAVSFTVIAEFQVSTPNTEEIVTFPGVLAHPIPTTTAFPVAGVSVIVAEIVVPLTEFLSCTKENAAFGPL